MAPTTTTTTKATAAVSSNVNDKRVVKEVKAWAEEVWGAVRNKESYARQHDHFFKAFDRLRDEIQSTQDPILHDHRCLINHVAPIFNHTASQGYQPHIHYQPLCEAVTQWCLRRSVKPWKAPADQFSRSPSPVPKPRMFFFFLILFLIPCFF